IEIDAIYKPGGFKISGNYQETPVEVSVAGAGIGASLLAKIKLMQGSTPYVFGGADFGYLLNQKTVVSAAGQSETSTDLEGVNRIAYGLDFGAGYELSMQGFNLLVEAKYYLGLSNMIKDPTEGAYLKPNGFTIGLGIKL
ncbi:MAG TPA: outer membrane beta-barrel protein, partial [Acidobacteriota bacterium]|nr:outer membrane beta-barrel protein [Acidobacteriota bacterium]